MHGGVQSVTKTEEGRRDALWENLHTVLCTMELPVAGWADSVFVCVTTILRSSPLQCASAQWDEWNSVKGCQITLAVQKVPFLQKTTDLMRDQCIDDLLKDYSD